MSLTMKEMKYLYSRNDFLCSASCLRQFLLDYEQQPLPLSGIRFFTKTEIDNQRTERSVWSRDLGEFFRSEWELIVAGFLNFIDVPYLYEGVIMKIGKRHYIPDFFIPDKNLFVEVKGLWLAGSKAKIRKIHKERPDINIMVIPWVLRRSLLEYMRDGKKNLEQ